MTVEGYFLPTSLRWYDTCYPQISSVYYDHPMYHHISSVLDLLTFEH